MTDASETGEARTRTLGILVVVMVAIGVVALVLTLVGHDDGTGQAGSQPSGSQVGNQTTTAPVSSAPVSSAPASSAAASTAPPSASTAPPSASRAPVSAAPARTSTAPAATKIVKYTVRRGDNLTLIAGWFHQRGYGLVYDWNKSVIGRNPNLIFPGQTIIVSLKGDRMTMRTGSGD